MRTLTIDIGGTGIKLLPIDNAGQPLAERHRELTPKPSTPAAVMSRIEDMVGRQEPFDRVSVGFPGVVMHGVVKTAPNLGTNDWQDFDVEKAIVGCARRPTRVINDADLQGYGVIEGQGVELVLTLGTGLGTALYVDGHLVPNLELAHHPFRRNETYEDLVSDAELKRVGEQEWRERVALIIERLGPIFNYDILHIGGGNAIRLVQPLPETVRLFENVAGLAGGIRLWQDESTKPT